MYQALFCYLGYGINEILFLPLQSSQAGGMGHYKRERCGTECQPWASTGL